MSANLQTYKVVNGELSSPTKQNNMVQAVEDALNAVLVAQISSTGASSGYVITYNGSSVVWAASASASAAGAQLDRKTITASVAGINATTEGTATAVITGNSVAYDGTEVKVEFFAPGFSTDGTGGHFWTAVLLCDAAVIGQAAFHPNSSSIGVNDWPVKVEAFHTPTAASHVYAVKVFVNAGSVTINAGSGGSGAQLPAFLRVTKA